MIASPFSAFCFFCTALSVNEESDQRERISGNRAEARTGSGASPPGLEGTAPIGALIIGRSNRVK
ncbi:MAG: hypothetical protein Q4G69_12505 [Planctomycetia bacterium]|nr:hypothetical protein [Planctomycetia bacterium]